jgi:dephospho-CoA kinase
MGSGKSTVAAYFQEWGIPVYTSDLRARHLMENDPELRRALEAHFGPEVFQENGRLNRPWLAGKIFEDESERQWINHLVHPAVGRDFERWATEQNAPYCLNEAALLLDSGRHRQLDGIVLVTAPESLRLERILRRDGGSREAGLARMRRQMSEEDMRAYAHWEISNDGHHALRPQVEAVHRGILEKVAGSSESSR